MRKKLFYSIAILLLVYVSLASGSGASTRTISCVSSHSTLNLTYTIAYADGFSFDSVSMWFNDNSPVDEAEVISQSVSPGLKQGRGQQAPNLFTVRSNRDGRRIGVVIHDATIVQIGPRVRVDVERFDSHGHSLGSEPSTCAFTN